MRRIKKWFRSQWTWEGRRLNKHQLDTVALMLAISMICIVFAAVAVVLSNRVVYG
jgi:hypothetical protein